MSSKRTREIQVSRSSIEAAYETWLRQIKEIKDNEDIVELQIGPMNQELVNVVYKVKPKELDTEVILHGDGKRKRLSQGV